MTHPQEKQRQSRSHARRRPGVRSRPARGAYGLGLVAFGAAAVGLLGAPGDAHARAAMTPGMAAAVARLVQIAAPEAAKRAPRCDRKQRYAEMLLRSNTKAVAVVRVASVTWKPHRGGRKGQAAWQIRTVLRVERVLMGTVRRKTHRVRTFCKGTRAHCRTRAIGSRRGERRLVFFRAVHRGPLRPQLAYPECGGVYSAAQKVRRAHPGLLARLLRIAKQLERSNRPRARRSRPRRRR